MIEIHADAKSATLIQAYLTDLGLNDLCKISDHSQTYTSISYNNEQKTFTMPIRLGTLLDQILIYNERSVQTSVQTQIPLLNGILDTTQGIFTNKDKQSIILTEKETEILSYLHAQKGETVSRKDLLSAIWNYADDVETHTLETHIYRLRQKIEEDTSEPKILITDGDGYYIT